MASKVTLTKAPSGPPPVPPEIIAQVLEAEKAEQGSLEGRLDKATSDLTLLDIEAIARVDPERAEKILSLQERLEKARAKQTDKESRAALQMRMLAEVENTILTMEANQKVCAMTGHSMPNGESAVMGQTDSTGTYRLTCVRCFQNYAGVGNGPGQIPQHLASRVNWENTGKSH